MVHKKKYDVVTTFPNYDLHGAAAAGNIGLVQYALRNGQPINAVLGGLLPLHAAACGGSVEVIKLLLDHGADVNAPRLPSSMGPPIGVGGAGSMVGPTGIIDDSHHHVLHHHHTTGTSAKGRAASAGGGHAQPPVTPMTRPGSSNNNGQSLPVGKRDSTPLHFAAALGHLDAVRLLLEKGANPAAKDVEKSTPEIVARIAGKTRIADFLKEWTATAGTEAVRRSFESPTSTIGVQATASKPFGIASELNLNVANNSTASLPLVASTAASHSTSSLGRYTNSGRRPSLPSIYESPPSTSYPRPSSSKKQRSPQRPATATSMNPSTSSLSKLPFNIRRPKSAGNREARGADDASSQHSHVSTRTQGSTTNTASRLNRIFKRPNLRPATASGALSTSPSPISSSPPVIARSRSPSTSRINDKDNRSGGFFHGHHLPHLSRRDHHHHPHPHPHHHLHLQHVSRDAISGPIMNGPIPSTSIPDISRPDLLDVGPQSSTSLAHTSPGFGDMSASPDEVDEEEVLYKALNLTPAELQYTKTRGALSDRLKSSSRTAPPGQSSFGIGRKASGSGLNRHPPHHGLSNKSTASMPSPHMVPRHRAHLGPNGGLAMTTADEPGPQEEFNRLRAETPLSFTSNTMDRSSPAVHSARPGASLTSLNQVIDNRATEVRQQGDGAGSISSLDSHFSGSIVSNDVSRYHEGAEDPMGDYISRPPKAPSTSATHSPGGTSPSLNSPGSMPFVDGRMISSRAQALELVEAQKRAIQTEHQERVKARRLASVSSHRTGPAHLANVAAVETSEILNAVDSSPNAETEDENASLDEDDVSALREKLAALGETVQIERRFARGEQQAKRWNRESGLEDGLSVGFEDADRGVAASMGASVLTRNEMLAGYLGQRDAVEVERVKMPSTPKRDVFGRPVTPKKEARPPTPKENRPATPKIPVTPTTSRFVDAPRENRVFPPPAKSSPAARSPQHLTLQQTRAISKSDLGLSSHINKDDLLGRERAWTTTDVRPRIGPATASRPSTAGAQPPGNGNGNRGLTINIIQTLPTPTDGGGSPLRNGSPMTPSSDRQHKETIQTRRRYNSNPLRIDATTAQEKALKADDSPEEARLANLTSPRHQHRQHPNPKSRKPTTPTKEQQTALLHRVTTTTPPVAPPAIALVPPSETPFNSYLSVSSNGGQATSDSELPPPPALPTAVSLHNMTIARAKEEALKYAENASPLPQGSPPDAGVTAGSWAPSVAGRHGPGLGNQNTFGYESVRSLNEDKGGDKSRRLFAIDSRESDTSTAGKSSRSRIGGLFSRLKR